MTIRTRTTGDVLIVYIDGYLNSLMGEELERVVMDALDTGRRKVLLNFEGTKLINSIGISVVIGIVEKILERDGMLAFCCLSRMNRELFRMTGVTRHVRAHDLEEEALGSFGHAAWR